MDVTCKNTPQKKALKIFHYMGYFCVMPIIICFGLWLASNPDNNECIHSLRWRLIPIVLVLLLVLLTGVFGALWNKGGLYSVCVFILVPLLLLFHVFAYVVTRPNGAYAVPGVRFQEYRLEGYSSWLRDHVTSGPHNINSWGKIRACLVDAQICPKLNEEYVSSADFFAADLSPIQSGCCKPPMACGFNYSNPTTWIAPSNITASVDCTIWNNDPTLLCYNCDSCKAGLLGSLRYEWKLVKLLQFNLIVNVLSHTVLREF